MVLWLWVLNSISICPQCDFVLFVIFCSVSFLLMACVLVLRVPAWYFWSLSRCHFTRPAYFKAVGAILNGSECPGSPSSSLGHEWCSVVLLKKAFTICCSLDWHLPDFARTLRPLWQGWVLLPEFSSLLWECGPMFWCFALWSWMGVLYSLVGWLLLCINTRLGVLCMTACLSHWFHQYYFVIVWLS